MRYAPSLQRNGSGKAYRLVIQRQRSINKELDLWEGEYTYRCILTNDYTSTDRDIVEYYNKRGGAERVLDDMNNGFGWKSAAKIVHGGKHGVPASDRFNTKLYQTPHI